MRYSRFQPLELALVQQQLAGADGVGDDVGAGSGQRGDVAAEQPGFTVLEQHVTVNEVSLASSQAFYFPAGQDQPGLELVFDEVIVSRFFILRDGPGRMFFCLAIGAAL